MARQSLIRFRRPSSRVPMNRMLKARRLRSNKSRSMKIMRNVHYFKRTFKLTNLTASVSNTGVPTPILWGRSFSLNDLPTVTDFTALFDMYKIYGIKLSFIPTGNSAILSAVSGNSQAIGFNRFSTTVDYDDVTPPVSEDEILQYNFLKTTAGIKPHKRYFKPKVLTETYRSALTTAYNPGSSKWMDLSQTDVPHYGIKAYCDAPLFGGVAASITYTVYATYYFACKNVR